MNPFERLSQNVENDEVLPDTQKVEYSLYSISDEQSESKILEGFTPQESLEIKRKQRILSSLAYFVGKDFDIPVLLNTPGGGWFWDQEFNHIKVDPHDLLNKPMDYLRFVICHEAGHRRISRIIDVIPEEVWKEKGFPFMFNAVEDCRDNNFVAEAYPNFKDQMIFSYDLISEEKRLREKAQSQLGQKPKSMQAGFEYMKQWLREVKGEEFEIDPNLPQDVKDVVEKTLKSAQDLWWRFPSKKEADKSEAIVTSYAKKAYTIAYESIWPEYKKLIAEDVKNQEVINEIKKMIEDMMKEQGEKSKDQNPSAGGEGEENEEPSPSGGSSIPNDLNTKLSPEQKQELEKVIEDAIEKSKEKPSSGETEGKPQGDPSEITNEGEGGASIDFDSLSQELKEKIKEYIENLPEDKKREIREKAEEEIQKFEKELAKEMQGKFSKDPEENESENSENQQAQIAGGETVRTGTFGKTVDRIGMLRYKERLERIMNTDANIYKKYEQELVPLINKLEAELRDIFVSHVATAWETGFRIGKRIDVKKRIQERARSIGAMESKSWQKRDKPDEKDFAVSILVDLSGSMREGGKIQETFKAVIVLLETLNRLGVKVELLGFNDDLYTYQNFGEQISKDIREHVGGMFKEVDDSCCKSCGHEHNETDLGWATKEATERLSKEKAETKILITLSDGVVQESSKHPQSNFEVAKMIKQAVEEEEIKVVGLGVGKGTEEVKKYYDSNLSGIILEEMIAQFPEFIKQAIADSQ